jgi:LPS sulfotransferase NodH
MTTTPSPIVILGQQRSGTTAFQRTLQTSKSIRNFGEVFQTSEKALAQPANFFHFKEKHPPNYTLPTGPAVREYFEKYLAYLTDMSDRNFFLIDIKYNSWFQFTPAWHHCIDEPFQLRLVKDLKIPILHVVRENGFLQALSLEYAMAVDHWHTRKNEDAKTIELRVDPKRLLRTMIRSKATTELFMGYLRGYPLRAQLVYEKMFSDSVPQLGYLRNKCGKVGVPADFGSKISLKKTPLDIPSLVSNKDEVLQMLNQTDFFHLAETAFGRAQV